MAVRRSIGAGLILLCLAGLAPAAGRPEDAAQAAAESWLALVDRGDYAGSWERAARALKAGVTQAEWARTTGAARSQAGKLVSRKLKSRDYTAKPPTTRVIGGKVYTVDESHVVLHYDTTFANKRAAVETVTAMPEPDGAWRVAGYSVR